MSVIYDAGALVAADCSNREVWADHRARLELGLVPVTTALVVAQVSRSPRQVQLRRFLRGRHMEPFSSDTAHDVGALAGASRSSDVVDAHLVLVAASLAAAIVSSDEEDLSQLVAHPPSTIPIIPL